MIFSPCRTSMTHLYDLWCTGTMHHVTGVKSVSIGVVGVVALWHYGAMALWRYWLKTFVGVINGRSTILSYLIKVWPRSTTDQHIVQ